MSTETNTQIEPNISGSLEKNIIYADRIFGFGVGPGVTKLHLGLEGNTPTSINAVGTLVLPTHALIDSLQFILAAVKTNGDMRDVLLKQIDTFRTQILEIS